VPSTRCSKREAYSRLLRPQRWTRQGLRSGVKGDAGFAGTDRCPFCDAGFHGRLTAHATRARVRSWPHNYGAASAKRRIPIAIEGELDKMAAPGPRASTPGQKVRRLAKVGEQVRGVGRRT
jgi:hypothetical protein